MKLRIRGDSLRLRLTRSEVAALVSAGAVSEQMKLSSDARFEYRLVSDAAAREPHALLESGALVVRVPSALAADWANSNTVGFEARQSNGGEGLLILVEKDFPCLTPRANEDDSDAFPRPEGHEEGPVCGDT